MLFIGENPFSAGQIEHKKVLGVLGLQEDIGKLRQRIQDAGSVALLLPLHNKSGVKELGRQSEIGVFILS